MRVRWNDKDEKPVDAFGSDQGLIVEIRSTATDHICQVDKTMVNGGDILVIWITPR